MISRSKKDLPVPVESRPRGTRQRCRVSFAFLSLSTTTARPMTDVRKLSLPADPVKKTNACRDEDNQAKSARARGPVASRRLTRLPIQNHLLNSLLLFTKLHLHSCNYILDGRRSDDGLDGRGGRRRSLRNRRRETKTKSSARFFFLPTSANFRIASVSNSLHLLQPPPSSSPSLQKPASCPTEAPSTQIRTRGFQDDGFHNSRGRLEGDLLLLVGSWEERYGMKMRRMRRCW